VGELRYFACGETTHDMAQLMRGVPRERRVFPSGVFLWEDGDRRVLFDTGYAPDPWRTGAAGWAYRLLLPPRVPAGSMIAERIDPASVTHVVLSHLHPDHIGGVAAFPHAAFVLHPGLQQTLVRSRVKDGVLRGLLPDGFPANHRVITPVFAGVEPRSGLRTHDLFGDGRYLVVDLPGHALGHTGALVEGAVLLAGDAAWGHDLLGQEARIKPIPRAVSHDSTAQAALADSLLKIERAGVRLLFSHDPHPSRIELT
jgi:glyoxylase-like metal-dependent hydrolase (beta-lactamase superfamily II)